MDAKRESAIRDIITKGWIMFDHIIRGDLGNMGLYFYDKVRKEIFIPPNTWTKGPIMGANIINTEMIKGQPLRILKVIDSEKMPYFNVYYFYSYFNGEKEEWEMLGLQVQEEKKAVISKDMTSSFHINHVRDEINEVESSQFMENVEGFKTKSKQVIIRVSSNKIVDLLNAPMRDFFIIALGNRDNTKREHKDKTDYLTAILKSTTTSLKSQVNQKLEFVLNLKRSSLEYEFLYELLKDGYLRAVEEFMIGKGLMPRIFLDESSQKITTATFAKYNKTKKLTRIDKDRRERLSLQDVSSLLILLNQSKKADEIIEKINNKHFHPSEAIESYWNEEVKKGA